MPISSLGDEMFEAIELLLDFLWTEHQSFAVQGSCRELGGGGNTPTARRS